MLNMLLSFATVEVVDEDDRFTRCKGIQVCGYLLDFADFCTCCIPSECAVPVCSKDIQIKPADVDPCLDTSTPFGAHVCGLYLAVALPHTQNTRSFLFAVRSSSLVIIVFVIITTIIIIIELFSSSSSYWRVFEIVRVRLLGKRL